MHAVPHRWLVLAAMAGSASMILLDQTAVAVALPAIGRELPMSPTGQQWVINADALAVGALVAFGGRLADRFGSVTTFRVGIGVFVLGSVLSGLAPDGRWGQPWILAARAIQGSGAALMIPVSAAMVVSAFPVVGRGRAMAVYGGISQVFLALGPVVSGLLTEHVSWRAVFWLNLPLGLAALLVLRIAHPDNVRRASVRIPAKQAVVLVVGLAATVLALQLAVGGHPAAPVTLVALLVGVVLCVGFVRAQLRSTAPLLDLRLLRQRPFLGNVAVLGMFQAALLVVVVFGSLFLQDVLGLGPSAAGVAVLAFVLPIAAAAQLGGRWYDRYGVRRPVLVGLAVTVVGLAVWAISLPELSFVGQLPGMVLSGFGLGLSASPCYTDALGRVLADRRGQAAGVVQTVRQLGGAVGLTVIGAVVLVVAGGGIAAAPPSRGAVAIAVGFGLSAALFLVTLSVGVRVLPQSRVTDDVHDGGVRVE